jgi:hypothetical protein
LVVKWSPIIIESWFIYVILVKIPESDFIKKIIALLEKYAFIEFSPIATEYSNGTTIIYYKKDTIHIPAKLAII